MLDKCQFLRVLRSEVFLRPRLKTLLCIFSSYFLQPEMSWIQGMFQHFNKGHCYFVTIVFYFFLSWRYWMKRSVQLRHRSFSNVEFGDLDKPSAVCSGRPDTWANTAAQWSVISYGNQHQPGRFCQRSQKKMPQINLALGIHLLLRLKTSSKLAKQQGAHGFSCKNFGS